MSLFETLKNAIFHNPAARDSSAAAGTAQPASSSRVATPAVASATAPSATKTSSSATTSSPAPGTTGSALPAVDVEGVLEKLNAQAPQKLNWRTSIVDLMKLVGMDSSPQHRKELAAELGYSGDASDSAAMNIWLHKAVMAKLAQNGGRVPAALQ
jgi:hypothetical protein